MVDRFFSSLACFAGTGFRQNGRRPCSEYALVYKALGERAGTLPWTAFSKISPNRLELH